VDWTFKQGKEGLVVGGAKPAIAEGLNDADNFDVGPCVRSVSQAHTGSDGISVAEVAPGEALIDDGRAEARAANIPPTFDFVSIPFVEVAPADERRSQCLEESRTDRIAVSDIIGHHTASGLDREPLVPTASTQQFRDAQRGVLHFGQVSKRNQQIAYQGSR